MVSNRKLMEQIEQLAELREQSGFVKSEKDVKKLLATYDDTELAQKRWKRWRLQMLLEKLIVASLCWGFSFTAFTIFVIKPTSKLLAWGCVAIAVIPLILFYAYEATKDNKM